MTDVVYRFFDRAGSLLYVGRTMNAPKRFADHRREKDWWGGVARIEIEACADHAEACRVERTAIRTEAPRHNISGVPGAPRPRTRRSLSGTDLPRQLAQPDLRLYRDVALGSVEIGELSDEQTVAVAAAAVPDTSRQTLAAVLSELNRRGVTFANIASKLGVHEATASRWARPATEDRRRQRSAAGTTDET